MRSGASAGGCPGRSSPSEARSEEHTSELQSRSDLVCRLLLEKKKRNDIRPAAQTTEDQAPPRPAGERRRRRVGATRTESHARLRDPSLTVRPTSGLDPLADCYVSVLRSSVGSFGACMCTLTSCLLQRAESHLHGTDRCVD